VLTNPYRKKLVAVLINPKSNINSKIQVLKVIDRIEETEPKINAFFTIMHDQAIDKAKEIEKKILNQIIIQVD